MAITVSQYPNGIALPAFNPIVYILNSTNSGQTNYKYKVDIRMLNNDLTWDNVTKVTLEKSPLEDGSAMFDVSPIIRDYVSEASPSYLTAEKPEPMSPMQKYYYTYWYATWDGGSEELVADADVTIGGLLTKLLNRRQAYYAVFDYRDNVNYDEADWFAGTSNTGAYMTNQPTENYVSRTAKGWLLACQGTDDIIQSFEVTTYNAAGVQLNIFIVENDYPTVIGTYENRFIRMPALPASLNLINNTEISGGVQPIIDASVASYTIQADGTDGYKMSFEFTINDACTKYEQFHIHFLNKFGGFDTFTFIGKSKKMHDIKRTTYTQKTGTRTSTTFTQSAEDKSVQQFATSYNEKYMITSGWISEAAATWLTELFTSPILYWQNGSDYIPCNITNSRYEEKKTVNEKLIFIDVELTIGIENIRQSI